MADALHTLSAAELGRRLAAGALLLGRQGVADEAAEFLGRPAHVSAARPPEGAEALP